MKTELRRLVEPDGYLATRTALLAGVSEAAVRWEVATGDLVRVGPGFVVGEDVALACEVDPVLHHEMRLRAALERCGPGAAAAGPSAALMLGLPLPGPPPRHPVVVRRRSSPRVEHGERSAMTVNRRAHLDEDEVRVVAGLRVTSPARTFVDLARAMPLGWGLAVADSARRRFGTSREELRRQADRYPTAPGHPRALRLASWADPLAESPFESVARAILLHAGVGPPEPQVWIGEIGAEYRVDLLLREFWTVVEIDGKVKYSGEGASAERRWQDKRRQDRLLQLGYDIHRFVAADAARPREWLAELLATCARSCRRRGTAPPAPGFDWPPGYHRRGWPVGARRVRRDTPRRRDS